MANNHTALFFPILVLMFTAVLYQSMAIADAGNSAFNGSSTTLSNGTVVGTLGEDGNTTDVSVSGYNLTVGFDWATGAIAVLVAGLAITVVVGVRVLGTGLSEFSVKAVSKVSFFYCLWLLVSAFGLEAFELMPFMLGWVTYLFLTMFYTFGVLGEL